MKNYFKRILCEKVLKIQESRHRQAINTASESYQELLAVTADLIRQNNYIKTLPLNVESYVWERGQRRENEELRKYSPSMQGLSKGVIGFYEPLQEDRNGTVVCLYMQYKLKIEGM